ncbi:MAG: hypothetical protein K2U26_18740, partial [Cyclobacteriaceae bacterium]|nr:hypothetical protein [Cyclobacteriaceae bacterium]
MTESTPNLKETLFTYSKSIINNRIVSVFIPILIIGFSMISYYWVLLKYNVNVPCSDDYGVALQFLNDFTSENSFLGKLALLFKQHVDHRVMFPRLVVLLDFFIQGNVNFFSLVIIGNLGLIWITSVLFISSSKQTGHLLLFCPIVLLVFQLQHWENAGFPTASIQSFYVIFFAFASLYLLSIEGRWTLALSCVAFFLSVFTSGNGMFCLLPGAFILFNKRKYRELAIWFFVFVCSVSFYFYNYSPQNSGIIAILFEKPFETITTFFVAIGGFINFSKAWEPIGMGYPLSIAFGVIVSLFFLYITFSKYYLRSPALYGFLFFLLITCAAMAVSRTSIYSANELSTVSRYKIVSVCCISVSYLIFIDIWKAMSFFKALLFIPLGLYYNSVGNEKNLSIFKAHTDRLIESS